jgi:hypothetical protein
VSSPRTHAAPSIVFSGNVAEFIALVLLGWTLMICRRDRQEALLLFRDLPSLIYEVLETSQYNGQHIPSACNRRKQNCESHTEGPDFR